MQTKTSTVKLPLSLIAKLKTLKKSHQAIAGVIEDLITASEQTTIIISPAIITRLEEYRSNPKESLDDLIRAVLDELETKINNLGDAK